jgi:hypothetical protein
MGSAGNELAALFEGTNEGGIAGHGVFAAFD